MHAVILSTSACLATLLALGTLERWARDRAWRDIPIRIHVNGSRGKSTVTRLIWSALREAGIPAVGKATGTAPRLLLPNGEERPIVRHAPASIREQLMLLRIARRLGAKAVVVECMAIDPDLQWVSEHRMLRSTVGVMTNVREDHVEVMGHHLDEIAATLANSTPRQAVLVIGEDRCLPVFETRTRLLGSQLLRASRLEADAIAREGRPAWLVENERTALAVTRHLGVPDEVAIRGFGRAPADPGAAREGRAVVAGRQLAWLDLTAANDPESLDQLAGDAGDTTLVYNNREDRAARLTCFARRSRSFASAHAILITGAPPALSQWRELRGDRRRPPTFVPRRRLRSQLRQLPADHRVIFCGNTRGLDVAQVMFEAGQDD